MITLVFTIMVLFSFGQEESVKMTKEEKNAEKVRVKKEKEDKNDADWLVIQEIAKSRKFVIEFDRFTSGRQLNSRLNFIAVYGKKVVLQLETGPLANNNGLGGLTIDGVITDFKYTPPKNNKKPAFISFNVTSKQTSQASNVNITIYKGRRADLSLGGAPNVQGDFLAPEESQIFIGLNMTN